MIINYIYYYIHEIYINTYTSVLKKILYKSLSTAYICNSVFPTGQSTRGAASASATVAGSLLGGAVVGGVVALLVVGILCGSWKLKHSGGKSCEVTSEEE